ncbi:hypothetical protein GCM10012280_45550 [Wenjunlia tyrosinilytica]|uniref:Uncharacterized protein n=1 Tax=Wenjunlia tyrosinilytica TaxID=1544741 RepID=A0A917ZU95_9ACTN|nr:hypothetical protein GCM10012280_45550 [Wenjunlia tyrosinilytica]
MPTCQDRLGEPKQARCGAFVDLWLTDAPSHGQERTIPFELADPHQWETYGVLPFRFAMGTPMCFVKESPTGMKLPGTAAQ